MERRSLLAAALLLLAAVGPYLPLRALPFLSDDYHAVAHAWRGSDAVLMDVTGPQFGAATVRFYRPVVTATLAVEHRLFGLDPEAHRWTNFAAHAACVLLVRALATVLGVGAAGSFAAAALFSLFPFGPGAVAWIVGRVDSLCAAFALGALVLHARARRAGRPFSAGSVALGALALGTKELAVALPFAAAAIEAFAPAGERRFRRLVPLFLLLAAYLVVRRLALGDWVGGYPVATGLAATARALAGLVTAGGGLLVPWASPSARALGGGILFLSLVALAFRESRAVARVGLALWVFFAVPAWTTLQEPTNAPNLRNLYLPFAGVALAAGSLVDPRRLVATSLPIVAIGASAAVGLVGSIRDHLEAGRVVTAVLAGIDREAAGCGREPVFVRGAPHVRGSAYALHWGFGFAMRPPFRSAPPEVRLLRPIFPGTPESRWGGTLAGRCLLEIWADGSVRRVAFEAPKAPTLAAGSPAFEARLTESALARALDGPDVPLRLEPAPPGPIEVTLLTTLGTSLLSLERAPDGFVRGVLLPETSPGLTLTHAIVQAFDAGDRNFLLHFRAEFPDGTRETELVPLRFADDVARAFRAFHRR